MYVKFRELVGACHVTPSLSCLHISVSQDRRLSCDLTSSVYSFACWTVLRALHLNSLTAFIPYHSKGKEAAQCPPTSLPAPLSYSFSSFIDVCVSPSWTPIHQSFSLFMYSKLICQTICHFNHNSQSGENFSALSLAGHCLNLWFKLQINVIFECVST